MLEERPNCEILQIRRSGGRVFCPPRDGFVVELKEHTSAPALQEMQHVKNLLSFILYFAAELNGNQMK